MSACDPQDSHAEMPVATHEAFVRLATDSKEQMMGSEALPAALPVVLHFIEELICGTLSGASNLSLASNLLTACASLGGNDIVSNTKNLQSCLDMCESCESLQKACDKVVSQSEKDQLTLMGADTVHKPFASLGFHIAEVTQLPSTFSGGMHDVVKKCQEQRGNAVTLAQNITEKAIEIAAEDVADIGAGGADNAPWKQGLKESPTLKEMAQAGQNLLSVPFAKKLKAVFSKGQQDTSRQREVEWQ